VRVATETPGELIEKRAEPRQQRARPGIRHASEARNPSRLYKGNQQSSVKGIAACYRPSSLRSELRETRIIAINPARWGTITRNAHDGLGVKARQRSHRLTHPEVHRMGRDLKRERDAGQMPHATISKQMSAALTRMRAIQMRAPILCKNRLLGISNEKQPQKGDTSEQSEPGAHDWPKPHSSSAPRNQCSRGRGKPLHTG
jgi:hypothetical protein